jgi:hypothetical protein
MPLEAPTPVPVLIGLGLSASIGLGMSAWMFLPLIRRWRRRAAIRSYTERLRPELIRTSGKKSAYTPEEIQDAARKAGVNRDYLCYAFADLLTREDFDLLHQERGETCDYGEMRAAVSAVAGECWSEAHDRYDDSGHLVELSHSGGHHDHVFGSFGAHHHSHHDHADHLSTPDVGGGGDAHAGHHESVDWSGGADFGGGGDSGGGGDLGGGGDFGGGGSGGDF